MKRHLIRAFLMTVVTTLLLGFAYPLIVTVAAQIFFRDTANGQIISQDGQAIGSRIIGQPFTGDAYFHSRPSAAGPGYDAANSGATNYGPTNKAMIDALQKHVQAEQVGDKTVPIDLVTSSASGLDPDITPAAAAYQASRVAQARHVGVDAVQTLIQRHTQPRQWGFLGEPRVNVLELNLDLNRTFPAIQ